MLRLQSALRYQHPSEWAFCGQRTCGRGVSCLFDFGEHDTRKHGLQPDQAASERLKAEQDAAAAELKENISLSVIFKDHYV